MQTLRALIKHALSALKIPVVRLTLFLCLGASSKALATTYINSLPIDEFARHVFCWLQALALVGFCAEVIRFVIEEELGIPIRELTEYLKRLFK
jgi:hypothetical protein